MTRGPRRSEESRRAILRSAGALLVRDGWSRFTVEGIAADAGVGKQTIYRWWPSKSAVVADALAEGLMLPAVQDVPDTGDVVADVTAWLGEVAQLLADPARADLIRSLISAAVDNEQVADALNERLGGAPTAVAGRLAVAVERGELPDTSSVQLITEALLGAVILRVLYRAAFVDHDARELARTVLGRSDP